MAQEEFEYRGHLVTVDTFSIGKRFGWQYQIDSEKPVGIKESGAGDEGLAVAEAKAEARKAIDRRMGSS